MKWLIRVFTGLTVLGVCAAAFLAGLFYVVILRDLPEIYSLEDYRPNLITRVYSADGIEISQFYKERREIVDIEKIPKYMVDAFIAAEDDAFYDHEGLDFPGILRAALANMRAGRVKQGGSTITQQVAKTFLLSNERSWIRKLKDMVLARRIENHLEKDQILYLYLNQIYLGSGAYGVEAAAQTYFGQSVQDLTLAEAALIAGLVPAPSRYTPRRSPEKALTRQRFVLRRMAESGFIDEEARQTALGEELEFIRPQPSDLNAASSYFAEEVRRYLVEKYGANRMLTGGLTVKTTLDSNLAIESFRSLRRGLREHDRRTGYRGPLRVLPKEDWDQALQDLVDTIIDPPEIGPTFVRGLVVALDDPNELVHLALDPNTITTLTLEDLNWARVPNPEIDGAVPQIRKVSEALKLGYLVWLEQVGEQIAPGADPASAPVPKYALYQKPIAQGSLFAMDADTGFIRAMVGGYSFYDSQFNRAVQSRRQPGSSFKPFIYAAALRKGYTPASVVYDTPIVYEDRDTGLTWKPQNYSYKFYGPITMRDALAHSRNVATIKILRNIGIGPVIEMAHAMGIQAPLQPNLSLALGTSEITLAELVRGYGTFASGGAVIQPVFISEVRDRDGVLMEANVELLPNVAHEEFSESPTQLDAILADIRDQVDAEDEDPNDDSLGPGIGLDSVTSYLMTDMLRAVVQEGTGWRAKKLGRPLVGKTGTTNDLFDAWFIGFSPQIVTGVWVGYDRARSLGRNETGSRAASPIWVDFMDKALRDLPREEFIVPDGVVFSRVDRKTGLLARPGQEEAYFQPFRTGTAPEEMSPRSTDGVRQIRPTRLD